MSNNFGHLEKLLGRENYPTWKFAMKSYLEHEDLWNAVLGTDKDEKNNTKARTKIILSVDSIIFVHIQDCKTAKEVWDSLKQIFDDSGLTRRIALLKTLITTKLNQSVEQYVNSIISTAHKLDGIGLKVSDEWIGCILLAGLPDEYKPMIMGLENSGLKISADMVKTKILQEVKVENFQDFEESNAMVAKRNFRKSQKGKLNSFRCFNCDGEGHYARNCPKKKTGEDSSLCSVFSAGTVNSQSWYFDSGATNHMTKHKFWMKDMKNLKDSVGVANNQKMEVKGTGKCKVVGKCGNSKKEVDVRDVLYIPELSTNLLSVSQITERGHTVIFRKSTCEVHDHSGKLVVSGVKVNGLYKLDDHKSNCMMASNTTRKQEKFSSAEGKQQLEKSRQSKDVGKPRRPKKKFSKNVVKLDFIKIKGCDDSGKPVSSDEVGDIRKAKHSVLSAQENVSKVALRRMNFDAQDAGKENSVIFDEVGDIVESSRNQMEREDELSIGKKFFVLERSEKIDKNSSNVKHVPINKASESLTYAKVVKGLDKDSWIEGAKKEYKLLLNKLDVFTKQLTDKLQSLDQATDSRKMEDFSKEMGIIFN